MISAPKLRSARVMAYLYLIFAILGIFWRILQLYEGLVRKIFEGAGQTVTVDSSFVDGFFVVCGLLSLLVFWGLFTYSKNSVLFATYSSLSLIAISLAFLVISILSLNLTEGPLRLAKTDTLFVIILTLPVFVPLALYNLFAFYFILRSLKYLEFMEGGVGNVV